jgi:uncharacterized membrane protein
MIGRIGELPWKGLYALLSIAGFVLIVWGFGLARQQPVALWSPPLAMRHVAALLTLLVFILLAAAYVPCNAIKARLHHPMVGAVKVWALRICWPTATWRMLCCLAAFWCGRS